MPRSTSRTVYVCTEGFSPAVPAGQAPAAFRPGHQVLEGDPILRTHGQFFVPAADRVEQTTAQPGERRPVQIPEPPRTTDEPTDPEPEQEPTHAQE